jgi:hypothetical protein
MTSSIRQSHGFFNDIPDRNWKYMQKKLSELTTLSGKRVHLGRQRESSTSQILNSLQVRA